MSGSIKKKDHYMERLFPHSPDVYERETSDKEYSKGWGMHFCPVERYWTDMHTHLDIDNPIDAKRVISIYLKKLNSFGVKQIGVILPRLTKGNVTKIYDSEISISSVDALYKYTDVLSENPNIYFSAFLNYDDPDVGYIEAASKVGIKGIKLHNAPLIMDGADCKVWLSDEWDKVFTEIERRKIPVLWHVVQRLTDSIYVNVGRNTYWKEGWEKGVKYTNEDLLEVFLQVVQKYPGIDFIGAHQLHLGWDRLCKLFDKHKNLYTDTTIGCFVREDTEIYDNDREYLRNIFIKYSDRILFGTDALVKKNGFSSSMNEYLGWLYKGHIRFLRQLRLTNDVLDKISNENAKRLFFQTTT